MILTILSSVQSLWTFGCYPLSTRLFQKECVKNESWRETSRLKRRFTPRVLLTIGLSPSLLKYSVSQTQSQCCQGGGSLEEEPSSLALCDLYAFGHPHWSILRVSLWSLNPWHQLSSLRSMTLSAYSDCIATAQRKSCMTSRVCNVLPVTWAGGHWCPFLFWEKRLSFMMSANHPSHKCSKFLEDLLSLEVNPNLIIKGDVSIWQVHVIRWSQKNSNGVDRYRYQMIF